MSRYDQPSDDTRDLTTPQADGDDGEPRLSDHARTIVRDGEDWRCSCSCGWLSLPVIGSMNAMRIECPVQVEWIDGWDRR